MLLLNKYPYERKLFSTDFPENIFLETYEKSLGNQLVKSYFLITLKCCMRTNLGTVFKVWFLEKFEYLVDKKGKTKIYIPNENAWETIVVICKIFMLCLPCLTISNSPFLWILFLVNDLFTWAFYLYQI